MKRHLEKDPPNSEELAALALRVKTLEKTNPKMFQVMQEAEKAGISSVAILRALREGDDSYANLSTIEHSFISAAMVVSITEGNRREGIAEYYIYKRFCQQVKNMERRSGADPAVIKRTFDVLREVYPQYSARIPA